MVRQADQHPGFRFGGFGRVGGGDWWEGVCWGEGQRVEGGERMEVGNGGGGRDKAEVFRSSVLSFTLEVEWSTATKALPLDYHIEPFFPQAGIIYPCPPSV